MQTSYHSITLTVFDPQIHSWVFCIFKHTNPRADFMNFPGRVIRLISGSTAAPIRSQAEELAVACSKQNYGTVVEYTL